MKNLFMNLIYLKRDSADWSGSTFDIAIIGHKIHEEIYNTNDFRQFLTSFPAWAYVSSWTGSFESWRL